MILRQTRGLIDQTLLDKAREQITSRMEKMTSAAPSPSNESGVSNVDGRFEKIDRQKNMATILKFIELKADNKTLMREMKTILQETRH